MKLHHTPTQEVTPRIVKVILERHLNLALVKTGAGTQALGANNSYIGGTSINGGTLQVDADCSLGDQRTAVTINGGTLKAGAGGIVIQRDVQLGANAGTIEGGFTLTGIIDGP